ncbi:hypothetical protein I7I48_07361 [Histoplasma ohiense]|nr:hypothetical protein I7I48_07361 [Histoplasma ohiense (nom. inval.)]
MAPPRQRIVTNPDDSRSEASSGTRERHPTGTKGRRPANTAAPGSAVSSRDMKVAAAITATSGHNAGTGSLTESTGVNWSSMPLSVLHQYRHAYNLPCPSAYSSQISSIILNQGVGLRSPTTIAARRAQLASQRKKAEHGNSFRSSKRDDSANKSLDGDNNNVASGMDLHRISTLRGQGRVTKDQLANVVRKHFNNVGLMEQDAIAKFLYKVREEGKGREFRLRFQP